MLKRLLLIAGILQGCGTASDLLNQDKQIINGRLLPYVQEFERDFDRGIKSSVFIGEPIGTEPGLLAECQYWKGTRNRVVMNSRVIGELSAPMLKAVLYHELGHCEYNLGHSTEGDHTLTDPYLYPSEENYYVSNWSRLVADLKAKTERK